jgi:hypothetical protein
MRRWFWDALSVVTVCSIGLVMGSTLIELLAAGGWIRIASLAALALAAFSWFWWSAWALRFRLFCVLLLLAAIAAPVALHYA